MTRYFIYYLLIPFTVCMSCNDHSRQTKGSMIHEERIVNTFRKGLNDISLDHFYITLDSITFNQIITSDFITGRYANLDQGIPDFTPIDKQSTSAYLRGINQYIEILGPQNAFNEPVGKSGLGFALRKKSGFSLDNVPDLDQTGTKFLKGTDTVNFSINNTALIWYKAFYTYGMPTYLSTWYAYYNPEFLEHLHQEEFAEYTGEAFLKKAYQPKKLFNSITGIELYCNAADYFRISSELKLLGCKLVGKNKDDLLYLINDLKLGIRLDKSLEKSKITTISGTLNEPDERTLNFKNLTIKNTGYKTVWTLY